MTWVVVVSSGVCMSAASVAASSSETLTHKWWKLLTLCTSVEQSCISGWDCISGLSVCTSLCVASSIWQILMHSERVKDDSLDMHCWYAFVLVTPATIQFLINFSLSPLHVRLHNSASLHTSKMNSDRVLLTWFSAHSCVKVAISSALGWVQSSKVSKRLSTLFFWCSSTVLRYVCASLSAHRVTYFTLVFVSFMFDRIVSKINCTSLVSSLCIFCVIQHLLSSPFWVPGGMIDSPVP